MPHITTYRRFFLTIADIYFEHDSAPLPATADIVRLNGLLAPVDGYRTSPFATVFIDLTRPEDELFAGIKSGTRRDIRIAMRNDGISAQLWHPAGRDTITEFCQLYDRFAKSKGLARANRSKLDSLAANSDLLLSCARLPSGEPLVWHAYVMSAGRARLLYSASVRMTSTGGQLVGRANRFLHWADILGIKEKGIGLLDLGGWHDGQEPELLRINAFKEEFGKTVVQTHNCVRGQTLLGELAMRLLSAAGFLRACLKTTKARLTA